MSGKKCTILLIGKTGNGKSTLGNTLAGRKVFTESAKASSETKHAQVHYATIEDIEFKIVDTIGIGDTELSPEAVCMRLADACVECKDGINQVLFVTRDKFTAEEIAVFNMMRDVLLGKDVLKFTTVVRTNTPKFKDPAWCSTCFEGCSAETQSIIKNVAALLFVNNPDEDSMPGHWEAVRAESRQRLLMRLAACSAVFKPPALQEITAAVQGMVHEHKEREEAIAKNRELLAENERMQRENQGNAAMLAELAEMKRKMESEIAEMNRRNEDLERRLREAPAAKPWFEGVFEIIKTVAPIVLGRMDKCVVS